MCIRLIILESMNTWLQNWDTWEPWTLNTDNRAIVAVQLVENCWKGHFCFSQHSCWNNSNFENLFQKSCGMPMAFVGRSQLMSSRNIAVSCGVYNLLAISCYPTVLELVCLLHRGILLPLAFICKIYDLSLRN